MPQLTGIDTIEKKLRKSFWQAQEDFNLFEKGDKIMVCLSGGKDSYTLLEMVLLAQRIIGDMDVVAVNLDQKQPGFPGHILPGYLKNKGVDYKIIEKDTYSIVKEKIPEGKTMCSLCSRLRRGILYDVADEIGATKIALGHHREDIVETFFLNLFFSGKTEAMPVKYRTDDNRHIVIRPLAYCREKDIESYALYQQFPIIPCNLCGSQEGLQRAAIKKMLSDWETVFPDRTEIILTALKNVHPSHLLDRKIFDFTKVTSKNTDG